MQWAREVSKLPDATFTLAYYPYSRTRNEASAELKVVTGCKWRTQLPKERFSVDAENLLLFTDGDGNPKMCYVAPRVGAWIETPLRPLSETR